MRLEAPRIISVIAGLSLLTAGCVETAELEGRAVDPNLISADLGLNILHFDPNERPQDDFYRWVNGRWLDEVVLPANRSTYGSFIDVAERTDFEIGEIVARIVSLSSDSLSTSERKVKSLYVSYMDDKVLEAQGRRPLLGDFRRIDAIQDLSQLSAQFAYMNLNGLDAPIVFDVQPDFGLPDRYAVYFGQSGLLLRNRIYYLAENADLDQIRLGYLDYVTEVLELAGFNRAFERAEQIFALESSLAKIHWPAARSRDREAQYNPLSVQRLEASTSNFDWLAYLGALEISPESVVVNQPDYLMALDQLMADTPLSVWQDYLRAHLLSAMAEFLPKAFGDAHARYFEQQISGILVSATRAERVIGFLNNSLPNILGRIYVERFYSDETTIAIADIFENIRASLTVRLQENSWLDPLTRQEALNKLAGMRVKIGHPEEWRRYSGLGLRDDQLFKNAKKVSAFQNRALLAKLDGPILADDWNTAAQSVNAFYAAGLNQIVIPAGILQAPFFSTDVDDAMNYGAIGGVIGHEIIHAFDDQGRKVDATGKLRDWWLQTDEAQFDYFTQAIVADFSSYPPFQGMEPNGLLTLGENIGDLGGLKIAYDAYEISLNDQASPAVFGFTGEQRFFMGWAQIWKRIYSPEALRLRIRIDVHAPAEFRVNWVLSNLPAFHRAFDVRPGDILFRASSDLVSIW